jgi:hypothetical protein
VVVPGRIGLTAVHAFAYGVPVVTCADSEVEQSPEFDYVLDGVNSVIARSASGSAIADAVEQALVPRRRAQLRLGADQTADGLLMASMAEVMVRAIAQARTT